MRFANPPHSSFSHLAGPNDFSAMLTDETAMSSRQKLTTTVSAKGQVTVPKVIRERLRWSAGTELMVEDTIEGVLLKTKPAFAATRPKDVFGSLPCKGPAKSIADMKAVRRMG